MSLSEAILMDGVVIRRSWVSDDGQTFFDTYTGKTIKDVKIIQQINPISTTLPASTADFSLVFTKKDIEDGRTSFKKTDQFKIYRRGNLVISVFPQKIERNSEFEWKFNAEDFVSQLSRFEFRGGVYSPGLSGEQFIESIFEKTKSSKFPDGIPYELIGDFSEVLSGYISYTNCRDALQQVCFALQAVVDTSSANGIKIYKKDESQTIKEIPKEMIGASPKIQDEFDDVEINLTYHHFVMPQYAEEQLLYDGEDTGEVGEISVVFDEPVYDIRLEPSTSTSVIYEQGSNFARFNSIGTQTKLYGKKWKHYEHTKTISKSFENEENDVKRINIEEATLISNSNVDNVLDLCYNYSNKDKSRR